MATDVRRRLCGEEKLHNIMQTMSGGQCLVFDNLPERLC